jgi:hypothetical protein
MLPHSPQYVREYVGNLYLSQRKCLSFDAEHNVLHFERKSLFVNYHVGSTAMVDHELARAISVKLSNGAKKLEKVLPIRRIQCRDKAGIYKDKFRKVAIMIKGLKLIPPGDRERR